MYFKTVCFKISKNSRKRKEIYMYSV